MENYEVIIKGTASIAGIIVVAKVLTALTDLWAARAIGRLCDKYEMPVEKRKEMLQRARERKVGR